MNTKVMFSSKTEMWETPQYFFDELNEKYHFNLDACATAENAKCNKFYTPEMDALKQDWIGTVLCNPPYGRKIGDWIKKAYEEVNKHNNTIIMLIPARTDTKYFHKYIYNKQEIEFIKGRLKFSNAKNSAPFPSMIVKFTKND